MKKIVVILLCHFFSTSAPAGHWNFFAAHDANHPGDGLGSLFDDVPENRLRDLGRIDHTSSREMRLVAVHLGFMRELGNRFRGIEFVPVDEIATIAPVATPPGAVPYLGSLSLRSAVATLRGITPVLKSMDANATKVIARGAYDLIVELGYLDRQLTDSPIADAVPDFQPLILEMISLLRAIDSEHSRELTLLLGKSFNWAAIATIQSDEEALYFAQYLAGIERTALNLATFMNLPYEDHRRYLYSFSKFSGTLQFDYVKKRRASLNANDMGSGLPIPELRKSLHETGLLFLSSGKTPYANQHAFIESVLRAEKNVARGAAAYRRELGQFGSPDETYGSPLIDDALVRLTEPGAFANLDLAWQRAYLTAVATILYGIGRQAKSPDLLALIADRSIYFLEHTADMAPAWRTGHLLHLRGSLADFILSHDWQKRGIRFRCELNVALGRFLPHRG